MRERKRVQKFFDEPSLTKQSFVDDCDVNKVVERFKKVNGVDFLKTFVDVPSGGQYVDVSNLPDYRSALNVVASAKESFMQLPSKLRAYFNNDVAEMLDFCQNPANKEEMVRLGLVQPAQPKVAESAPAEPAVRKEE